MRLSRAISPAPCWRLGHSNAGEHRPSGSLGFLLGGPWSSGLLTRLDSPFLSMAPGPGCGPGFSPTFMPLTLCHRTVVRLHGCLLESGRSIYHRLIPQHPLQLCDYECPGTADSLAQSDRHHHTSRLLTFGRLVSLSRADQLLFLHRMNSRSKLLPVASGPICSMLAVLLTSSIPVQ